MNKIKGIRNNKYLRLLASFFIGIIILLCTVYIFAYSYGFRLTFDRDQPIEKTGVLSIDSVPFFADVYLNDTRLGKSPKTEGSISEGKYTVSVKKDGYKDWQKVLPIESQRSTPFTAYLFFSDAKYESEYKMDSFGDYKVSPDRNHIFIPAISTDTNNPTDSTKFLTITDYKINRFFWDFTPNPNVIFKAPYTSTSSYEIQPSELGNNLLVYKYLTNTDGKKTLTETYIIKTSGNNSPDKFEKLPLTSFYNGYKFIWAKDEKHLVIESDSEILSYDINTKAIALLTKKTAENQAPVWKTDELGYFYILEKSTLQALSENINNKAINKNFFRILRKDLNGTNPIYVLDNIFYTTDNKGISSNTDLISNLPFTVSPFSTRFAGEITDFEFQSEGDGIVISTQYGLYWYSEKLQKYYLVDTGITKLLNFSKDATRIAYINSEEDTLKVLTFLVEPTDHLDKFGSKTVITEYSKSTSQVQWLSNSYYLSYINGVSVNTIDFDGENNYEITKLGTAPDYIFSDDMSYVYTFFSEKLDTTNQNSQNITVKKFLIK